MIALLPNAGLYISIIKAYLTTALGFMIGAATILFIFIILGISRKFIKYKIIWKEVPIGCNLPITFHLPYWKKIVLLGILPDLGEVRAEVKYRYGESSKWQHNSVAEWKRKLSVEHPVPIGSQVIVKGTSSNKLITIFKRTPNGQICTIHHNQQVLPNQFEYMVNLIREANGEILHFLLDVKG